MNNMERIALETRQKIFEIVCENKAGHLASSLSSVEILTTLYFGGILKYRAEDPAWKERDRFILSKGHSALGLYVTLAKAGYFDLDEVKSFCVAGTKYGGLPLKNKIKGVEATTGSLGHGLSFAAGMAMNAKVFSENYRVFVLIGDGELQEGSIWEAAMFISQNKLRNLICIVDFNKIQATGKCEDIIEVEPLLEKWESFGFEAVDVDGHNMNELKNVMIEKVTDRPRVIIANTVKGKGLSFVENMPDWHYRMPTKEQIDLGRIELNLERKG